MGERYVVEVSEIRVWKENRLRYEVPINTQVRQTYLSYK